MKPTPFASEAELCATFIGRLPKGWTAYPESGGFDILLSRIEDGFQIGVEAKLKLNAKVMCQALEDHAAYRLLDPGPDCRAVLVPNGVSQDMAPLCAYLGLTVVSVYPKDARSSWERFFPHLPDYGTGAVDERWFECAPAQRLPLPDYVPDVAAGASAPLRLTAWKIAAIKIAVTLERRGFVTRADFKHHRINMRLWTDGRWIVWDGSVWRPGTAPDLRVQHPKNYAEIEADYALWVLPDAGLPAMQGALV